MVRPARIYVADFDLQAARIQEERGLLPPLELPDPIRRILPHQTDDPNEMAVKLVNLMSDSIVTDLAKAGYSATKLAPGQQMPSDGWLVRGVFTQVQEGNQLRRAVIGFGAGKTDLQVVTSINRLADGPPKPLYEVQTDATSGNGPGGAAMIVLNPPAGAAMAVVRCTLAGNDLNTNVKKTAKQIAVQIEEQIASKPPPAARS